MTVPVQTRLVTVVYGTRPEAIKCAPVVLALQQHPAFEVRVVVTGQHRGMLDQVNELFGIVPDLDLDLHRPGQSLTDLTVGTLRGVTQDLSTHPPQLLLCQGDTTSAFAAGLAAFYHQVPLVHLEAGLRTGDLTAPFPEEANRTLLSRIASLHLAATAGNRANLETEAIDPSRVTVIGNTVIDALHHVLALDAPWADAELGRLVGTGRPYVLVTAHRRESWGAPMEGIARALARIAGEHPDHDVVVPAHANPRVREVLDAELQGIPNAHVLAAAGYADFCRLLRDATVVLSDSGGVQEEGPAVGTPVLVLRETTERPEALAFGTVRLVGVDEDRIVAEVGELLTDEAARAEMTGGTSPYGDGQAARRAVEAMAHLFDLGPAPVEFAPVAPTLSAAAG